MSPQLDLQEKHEQSRSSAALAGSDPHADSLAAG
jgi:hypothetical protein